MEHGAKRNKKVKTDSSSSSAVAHFYNFSFTTEKVAAKTKKKCGGRKTNIRIY